MSDIKAGLPSTAAVQDPEARNVLQRIIDILNIRQGYTKASDAAFITRADLRKLGVAVDRLDGTVAGGTTPSAESVRNSLESLLGTDIRAIQAAIAGSPNWQLLGAPITPIPGQGGKILDVRQTFNNKFAAFAQLGYKIQSSIGNLRVTVEQNAQTLTTLDGKVSGQWYVKIDNTNQVAGFGLFSTANNGATVSEFYVRADRFAIGNPGVIRQPLPDGTYPPATPDEIPFIVFSTPTVIDGKTVQPGVYMNRTYIHDGAIQNAMIGTAAVNTLEIAGNAVTVPVIAAQGGLLTLTTSPQTLISASVTYDSTSVPNTTFFMSTMNALVGDPGGGATMRIGLYVDGSQIGDYGQVAATGMSFTASISNAVSAATMGAGSHTVEVKVHLDTAPATAWQVASGTLYCQGVKR